MPDTPWQLDAILRICNTRRFGADTGGSVWVAFRIEHVTRSLSLFV
jgi:hypothetical protein